MYYQYYQPFNFGTGQNLTRKRTEPNRSEPRRVQKTQAEPHRTGNLYFPNRTDPNRRMVEKSGTETNRTEPNQFLPVSLLVVARRRLAGDLLHHQLGFEKLWVIVMLFVCFFGGEGDSEESFWSRWNAPAWCSGGRRPLIAGCLGGLLQRQPGLDALLAGPAARHAGDLGSRTLSRDERACK